MILISSISHTNGAPASSEQSQLSPTFEDDYNDYDEDYSDEASDKGPETAENRLMPQSSSTSTTTTFRPIFSEFFVESLLMSDQSTDCFDF